METARHQFSILKQICELIPGHLVTKLAREHGVEEKCRTFGADRGRTYDQGGSGSYL